VAGFIGSPPMNLFDCTLTIEKDRAYLDASDFKLEIDPGVPAPSARNPHPVSSFWEQDQRI